MTKIYISKEGTVFKVNDANLFHSDLWEPTVIHSDGTMDFYQEQKIYYIQSPPGEPEVKVAYAIKNKREQHWLSNPNRIQGL